MGIILQFPVSKAKPAVTDSVLQLGAKVRFSTKKFTLTGLIVQIKHSRCLVATGDINIWDLPLSEVTPVNS